MTLNFVLACLLSVLVGFCMITAVCLITNFGKEGIMSGWGFLKVTVLVLCVLIGAAIPVVISWDTNRVFGP